MTIASALQRLFPGSDPALFAAIQAEFDALAARVAKLEDNDGEV